MSSPCTPLRGRGPAPALPGVKEDPNDAILMTCQKERALHAAVYFTAKYRMVITIHLCICQDLESMLAVRPSLLGQRCIINKKKCVDH